MALFSQGGDCRNKQRQSQIYNNPFVRRGSGRLQRASIEEYIKAWIEDIFYNNKKIDIQAKASIYRKLISDKFYELSSCSIVYSIIREKIKEICLKLRTFINLSYRALLAQNKLLSNLTATGNISLSGAMNEGKRGGEGFRGQCLTVAVARGYVISYRYMCEVAKETFNFWKILYECIQVKDLRFNSLQSSLNEFILDTFVQPSEGFDPRQLLPNIAFPLKCKFIYAEPDGIKKREELTKFYDDQTVRRLLRRDDLRPSGEHQMVRARQELGRSQQGWSLAKKYEMFHRPRMDLKQLQHLRKCYLDPEAQSTEQQLFASLFPPAPRDTAFSQEKLDLIRSLQQNHQQLFQIEDTSSQQDSPDPIFYDDTHPDREDLLQEQDNIEMELAMNPEKHHNEEVSPSDGSTKSEPNDDAPEHADLPMRNYQTEPPPPEFIMGEHPQEREKERAQVRRAIELLSQYSHERRESSSSSEGRRREEKMAKLKVNIAKSKQIRCKEKKVQFLDKRQLQEQKQKLEKYRRQLQKQKEELLREVQKFMKQKKKQSNLLALIKDKARYKFTRNYKCNGINHKIIHKLEKHQQKIESITLKYDLNCQDELLCHSSQPFSYSHSYKNNQQQYVPTLFQEPPPDTLSQIMQDKLKMKEIQQAVAKDLLVGDTKLTKKQQKMKKKLEHQALQLEESPKLQPKKSERGAVTEQEAALTNFLERLKIDEDARAPCNVEEDQISHWKARAENYRRNTKLSSPPPQSSQLKEQPPSKQESGRKQSRPRRKKNRR